MYEYVVVNNSKICVLKKVKRRTRVVYGTDSFRRGAWKNVCRNNEGTVHEVTTVNKKKLARHNHGIQPAYFTYILLKLPAKKNK